VQTANYLLICTLKLDEGGEILFHGLAKAALAELLASGLGVSNNFAHIPESGPFRPAFTHTAASSQVKEVQSMSMSSTALGSNLVSPPA
jgi:hypothetical protein